MAYGLMVTRRASQANIWQAYEMNDPQRQPGTVVSTTGRLAGSVKSWDDLKALAAARGVQGHQIQGDGLAEMTDVLGPERE
jgi:hypothetical protein